MAAAAVPQAEDAAGEHKGAGQAGVEQGSGYTGVAQDQGQVVYDEAMEMVRDRPRVLVVGTMRVHWEASIRRLWGLAEASRREA